MLSNLKKQRKLIVIKDCLFKISFAYFIPFIFVSFYFCLIAVCYERVKEKLIIMLLFRRKGTFLTPIKRSAVPANDTINATFE